MAWPTGLNFIKCTRAKRWAEQLVSLALLLRLRLAHIQGQKGQHKKLWIEYAAIERKLRTLRNILFYRFKNVFDFHKLTDFWLLNGSPIGNLAFYQRRSTLVYKCSFFSLINLKVLNIMDFCDLYDSL